MSNIVIVGADQGIGYYLAQSLLEAGNKVAVMDIRTEHIERLKGTYPDTLMVLHGDATNEVSIVEGVKKAHESFGSIDIAIHNACLCTFESEPDSGIEIYQKVMDVNYYGALRLAKAALPFMREAKGGRLIFTSSGVGVTGFENISPYASSKGAIEALAKCLEIENSKYGISVRIARQASDIQYWLLRTILLNLSGSFILLFCLSIPCTPAAGQTSIPCAAFRL